MPPPACHHCCRGARPCPRGAGGPRRARSRQARDLARGPGGHRRPEPGERHCERHEHGPDDDQAGAMRSSGSPG